MRCKAAVEIMELISCIVLLIYSRHQVTFISQASFTQFELKTKIVGNACEKFHYHDPLNLYKFILRKAVEKKNVR